MTACSGSGAPTCQFFTGLFIQHVFLKSPSVAGTLLAAGVVFETGFQHSESLHCGREKRTINKPDRNKCCTENESKGI